MLISQQRITPKISDLLAIFGSVDESIIRKWIPKKYIYWVGSGREALRQILLNLDVKKIGVPAYTCHVVSESVKRAGKTPIFYDSGVIAETEDIFAPYSL